MKQNSDDIIANLRDNLKRIIQLYEAQKAENEGLKEQNEKLSNRITLLESKTNELATSNNTSSLAKAFATASGTNHDAKIKVNSIVREIDKCIALLNK